MNRREFLQLAALAAATGSRLPAQDDRPQKHEWKLRYAPRLDFLGKLRIPERLEKFAEYGFTATEYNGLMNHDLKEVEAIRKKLDELRIEMGIFVGNPGGWSKTGLCDAAQRDAFLAEIRKAVEYHKVVGNRFCTVITGMEKKGLSREQMRQNVVDGLKAAAEIVEGTDLTLVVEPLNVLVDHPGYFLVSSKEAYQIMKAVGSPRVKILFDIYHQQISEGNLINNIRRYWDEIAYFQIGDVPGRREPGTGEINWKNVFKAIHAKGYRGILGMEHGLSKDFETCVQAYREADSF